MKSKKINMNWLYCAVSYNEDGSRQGTISQVNRDMSVVVLARGKVIEYSSKQVLAMVESGLIRKNNAIDSKYI